MARDNAQIIKPRSRMDRLLARLEQQRIWEHVGQCVADDLAAHGRAMEIAEQAIQLAESEEASPTLKLRALSCAREFMEFAHRIRKDTFLDRTIPTVSRVDAQAAIMALPTPEGEVPAEVQAGQSPEEASKAESIALLRGVIALLQGAANGNSLKPGLVILRDEERHAG